jgi:hypothetical protein
MSQKNFVLFLITPFVSSNCSKYGNIFFSIVDKLAIMQCVRTNKAVQSELRECVKDLYQKIIWNGNPRVNSGSLER